jgi:hypothetical protein
MLDSVLSLSQRRLGVMQPRPASTLHVGGSLTVDGPTVALPAGSVPTAALAPNSVQQLLVQDLTNRSWTIGTSINTWLETAAQVSVVTSGGLLRVEFFAPVVGPSAAAPVYLSIGVDGVMPTGSLQYGTIPGANYVVPMSGVYYTTPSAGTHRISIFMYAGVSGCGFSSGALTGLIVTEQKR